MEPYIWRDRVVDWLELSEAERDEIGVVMPPDGRLCVLNMPNERYHRGPGYSCTQLKRLFKSAWSFLYGEEVETTDAMMRGTLAHFALLEPDKLDERAFAFLPQKKNEKGELVEIRRDKRTKEYQEFLAGLGERQVVRRRDWNDAREVAIQVREHPAVKAWLNCAADQWAEVSIYWRDPATGLLFKIRPDWLTLPHEAGLAISCWDLKTRKDCDYKAVQFSGERYEHFPFGASFYTEGCHQFFQRPTSFNYIIAEPSGAREVACYQYEAAGCVTPIARIGRADVRRLMNQLAECVESDTWPRQQEGIADMEPSGYYLKEHEDDLDTEHDQEPF